MVLLLWHINITSGRLINVSLAAGDGVCKPDTDKYDERSRLPHVDILRYKCIHDIGGIDYYGTFLDTRRSVRVRGQ